MIGKIFNSIKFISVLYIFLVLLAFVLFIYVHVVNKNIIKTYEHLVSTELNTLDHLIKLRFHLNEYERLLYEYYATVDHDFIDSRLLSIDSNIQIEIEYLNNNLDRNTEQFINVNNQFNLAYRELQDNFQARKIDWDAARDTLSRVTDQSRRIKPVIDDYLSYFKNSSTFKINYVQREMKTLFILIIFSVSLLTMIVIALIFFIRNIISSQGEIRRLAHFPERNPGAVYRLSKIKQIEYQNPASKKMAGQLNVDNLLPDNLDYYTKKLEQDSQENIQFDYKINDQCFSADLHYLRDLSVFHLYIKNITQQYLAEQELRYLAYHDPATGLPNQRSYIDECNALLEKNVHYPIAAIIIGFNRFEQSVRNLSIEATESLLRIIAEELMQCLNRLKLPELKRIRLYRGNGAHFISLIEINEASTEKTQLIEKIANNVIDEITSKPFSIHYREIWLDPLMGSALIDDDCNTAIKLLGNATVATAWLQDRGHHGYQSVTPEIITGERTWQSLENKMRKAIKSEFEGFSLVFQPKICLFSMRMFGTEALLRWKDEDNHAISPAEFIPVAEQSGLILPLGEWVFDTTCKQIREWRGILDERLSFSVNISQSQLSQKDFVNNIQSLMQNNQVSSSFIELEITESMLMRDVEDNLEKLKQLRQIGVSLALDDFGTGYSSLEYLHYLPISKLKIDKSFIQRMELSERYKSVVKTIVNLSHELDLQVIAEGVENVEQLTLLKEMGCDEVQGFYFSKPLAADEFKQWVLKSWQPFNS